MASPVIETAATSSTNTAGTSHVVTLPSGITAGDLILVLVNIGSTAATYNTHADYTERLDESLSGGLKILYRWADGTETDPTFTSSANTRDATITYRISGAENPATQPPEIGTTAASTDPPTVTPTGGSKDYLFIAMCGATGEQADNGTFCTAFPTSYAESQQQKACGIAGTNLGGMIAAAGFGTTASSGNPSAFTVSDAGNRSQTIAVHPTTAVTFTAAASLDAVADIATAAESFSVFEAATSLDAVADIAVAGTVIPGGNPYKVENLVATAVSSSQIDLSWDDVTALTGEAYDIERDGTVIVSDYTGTHSVGSPYQDTGLTPATLYEYRVRAVGGTP